MSARPATRDGQLAAREILETIRMTFAANTARAEDSFLATIREEDEADRLLRRLASMAGIADLPEYETRRQRIRKAVA